MNEKEIIKKFRLLWGVAPKGTLKYKKGKDIEAFLLGMVDEINKEMLRKIEERKTCFHILIDGTYASICRKCNKIYPKSNI